MGDHPDHQMHANSLRALGTLDCGERERQIVDAYVAAGVPQTDRQIAERLGYQDMNKVRPRISDLIDDLILREVGSTKDHVSGKRVRLVEVRP